MTNWPTVPLIRIIQGTVNGEPIANEIARKTKGGNFSFANRLCVKDYEGDEISEWEEVTAVPTAALKRLQDAFRGVDMTSTLVAALQEVTSHLPADKPSALAWAAQIIEAAIILVIRDGQVTIGGEKLADLADVLNPDLIRREVADGQDDSMVAPLDEWRGEIRVPVAAGFLA